MVGVRICFRRRGQEWTRDFDVALGATVRDVKELMLSAERSDPEDLRCFELHREGSSVPDNETIWSDAMFSWKWLGLRHAAGAAASDTEDRRMGADAAAQDGTEKEAAAEAASEAAAEAPELERTAAAEAPEAEQTARTVNVTVRHALVELESEITVPVPEGALVCDVRRAVLDALGEAQEDQVRIVQRLDGVTVPVGGSESIGARREFLSTGRKLTLPVQKVRVSARHAFDSTKEVTVEVLNSSTVYDVNRAVMKAIGEKRDSQVKIVRSVEGSLVACDNFEKIGQRREFLYTSPGAAAVSQVAFRIRSRDDGSVRELSLPEGRLVRDLKIKLCEEVQRGSASSITLETPQRRLHDGEKLQSIAEEGRQGLSVTGVSVAEPKLVEITIRHYTQGHSVKVWVHDTASVLELRRIAAERLKSSMNELKLCHVLDRERLNGRTEFQCRGLALERPPPPCPEEPAPQPGAQMMKITVFFDRASGRKTEIRVQEGTSILAVKSRLAEGSAAGPLAADGLSLSLPTRDGSCAAPLPDDAVITRQCCALDARSDLAEVTLAHVSDGSKLLVAVPVGATIADVRQAAMRAIGSAATGELRIVRAAGLSYVAVPDAEVVERRTDLFTTGRSLAQRVARPEIMSVVFSGAASGPLGGPPA